MILLKSLKVNGDLQVFKFKWELFNLNKINIVKREIKRYEEECNYGYIECPCCGSDKFIGYGSYEKNVIIYNECSKIKIKRVKCKNCERTHALIPYFLVPYFQYEKTLSVINMSKLKSHDFDIYDFFAYNRHLITKSRSCIK